MMKWSGVLLLIALILPLLFAVHCSEAIEGDPKPAGNNRSVNGSVDTKLAPPDSEKTNGEKRVRDQNRTAEGETRRDNEGNGTKKNSNTTEDKSLVEPKVDEGKGNGGSESGTTHVEGAGAEECDPSNRCIDEKNKFVACLRVPGKDSLDLSLLIQNKGTETLDVNIVTPSFVNLEQAMVQLRTKENKEVKISYATDVTNDTVIVLKAGDGNCSIDFQNMITAAAAGKNEPSRYTMNRTMQTYIICAFVATAVVIVSVAWLCFKFRRQGGGPVYQKVEVEVGLPVSSGGKKETDEIEGWDDTWGDGWDDDEEAAAAAPTPTTPSNPAFNPSSRGLASRRSNKDAWKD